MGLASLSRIPVASKGLGWEFPEPKHVSCHPGGHELISHPGGHSQVIPLYPWSLDLEAFVWMKVAASSSNISL